jgi:restriction system protein
MEMEPVEFEELIEMLLVAVGFEDVKRTPISKDGGIDVRGTLVVGEVVRTKMAVQVKRWKSNIRTPAVRELRGSLGAHEHALIITTSDFSAGAKEEGARPDATPVALMNGEQLVGLLVENGLGVRRTSHDLIELAETEEAEC